MHCRLLQKFLRNRQVAGEGGLTIPPPPLPNTLTSRFRNYLCKYESTLFSRFLHGYDAVVYPFMCVVYLTFPSGCPSPWGTTNGVNLFFFLWSLVLFTPPSDSHHCSVWLLPEPRDRNPPFLSGENLFWSHSIQWAKHLRRFYSSNLKYFYNFYVLSETRSTADLGTGLCHLSTFKVSWETKRRRRVGLFLFNPLWAQSSSKDTFLDGHHYYIWGTFPILLSVYYLGQQKISAYLQIYMLHMSVCNCQLVILTLGNKKYVAIPT